MKIDYRRELEHQYMIVPVENEEIESSYKMKMMLFNNIPGMLCCHEERLDGQTLLYYEMQGMMPLCRYLEKNRADTKLYHVLFVQIASALKSIKEYLLEPSDIYLSDETVFINRTADRMCFIIYPSTDNDFSSQLFYLSESLLLKLDNNDIEAMKTGYAFYKDCADKTLTSEMLLHMAYGGNNNGDNIDKGHIIDNNVVNENIIDSFDKPFESDEQENESYDSDRKKHRKDKQIRKKRDKENVVEDREEYQNSNTKEKIKPSKESTSLFQGIINRLRKRSEDREREEKEEDEYWNSMLRGSIDNGANNKRDEKRVVDLSNGTAKESAFKKIPVHYDNETTLLSQTQEDFEQPKAYLVPLDVFGGDNAVLDQGIIIVGKKIAGANVVINSPAVSRKHARLSWQDNAYVLTDLGSTNGTYVNGNRLKMGTEAVLKDNDEVIFADIGYRYVQS